MNFKLIILILFISINTSLLAGLSSPFISTVSGLDIPNAHIVYKGEGTIIRSMAPKSHKDFEQIKSNKFTDILIFKNQTRNEVDQEVEKLIKLGYTKDQIHIIPFKWKGHESFEVPCKQTIKALKIMLKVAATKNQKLLLHCTVGEDRTGYISALFKSLLNKNKHTDVFKNEMCFNGYGAGNPNKPFKKVVLPIRKSLTPLFLKMAYKIDIGYLSKEKLDEKQCLIDPSFFKEFKNNLNFQKRKFKCEPSDQPLRVN